MNGIERDISMPQERLRDDLNGLFDYDRRSMVHEALSKRFGARWQEMDMRTRTDRLYELLGKIRDRAVREFGEVKLKSAYPDERNMMLDAAIALVLRKSAPSAPSREKAPEQTSREPQDKGAWLSRNANLFPAGTTAQQQEAAYQLYASKVRKGVIKP